MRHHPDDRIGLSVEQDGPADHAGIGPEMSRPEPVAEERDGRPSRPVLLGCVSLRARYGHLSAVMGSTRRAWWTGAAQATRATATKISETATKVSGSRAPTP